MVLDAKEYLMQVEYLSCKIRGDRARVKQLRDAAESTTGIANTERVQSSGSGDPMGRAVGSYVDLEAEIRKDEQKLREIIETINQLRGPEKTVIYQYYVMGKFLYEIASDMQKSYSWVSKKHVKGIDGVQDILDSKKAGA